MKKIFGLLFMFLLLSCKGNVSDSSRVNETSMPENKANIVTAEYKTGDEAKIENIADNMGGKILVVYFSRTGNTKYIAEYIKGITKADIFEIVTVNPYPTEYRATTEQATKELNENYLPELKAKVQNFGDYDTIILGYPIWWGTIPQAVKKFILDNNFSGKTIAPFCTHGGSGLSRSVTDIKKIATNAVVTDAFSVRGAAARNSQNEINAWLNNINVLAK